MDRSLRIGVIGCGFFAQNHLHSWSDLAEKGAQLAAVCDVDAAKARAAGETFRVPYYSDAAKMLEAERLDVADIVTRRDTHRPLAEMALARGLATIVQKPFASTWEDCIAIVEAAHKANAWLAVHENFRFQAPMRAVRKVIDSGAIGTPSWARIRFRTGFDVYKTQPYFYDEEQLAIADVGIHMLDLSRFFLGEVEHISCETQKRNPRIRAEDTATMLLRHQSGAVSVVECTYESRRLPDHFPETLLVIEGPRGAISLEAGCSMTVTSDGATWTEDASSPLLSWTAYPWHVAQQGVIGACGHFLDSLQRGVPPETSGEDNLKTYALVDAAYRAASERRAVEPKRWNHGLANGGERP
ncbi:Gfo/Idh/MocA family oxidoreductase [Mesorhizobium sp. M1A.F.Ca.ET.072.01.1.1]|uniref:Gfo/Idh/MocA family protein n=1 Tax=Mesorhizobium sp. M1A.F.Ca.ET.072.01.1.1 TaxID=2496753 RepID=UPI000FD6033D|nr:Gfo/Idh/MocA family oxidoreductase [Mesorhizobium sp. M1A.F.Ca.ET.072.01.1.1]RUW46843.1 Gfo/Idh/MocA family oxidoreductase [Mesorhizobium sp. M1A.F.Ca.ET.072.01.1.1]TIV02807.1 MAG: Gfo/Idh/MocA family oxidoreductase [Mesorhizobium sp.]